MKYISVEEFIKETEGKAYDIDHTAGIQCVDGIKKFNMDVYGVADFNCGNGWAYGLWTNYGTNGVEKYFDKYSYKEGKQGDWIIWNKNSKPAPKSHVAMLYKKLGNGKVKSYGQNQNGIKAFNFADISEDGILGVLRPKIYLTKDFFPARGYFTMGDSGENVKKINDWYETQVHGSLFGIYSTECTKALQTKGKQDGVYDDEIDGNFGRKTLETAKYYGFKE